MSRFVVVISGLAGSGKSSLAKMIQQHYPSHLMISTGDIARHLAETDEETRNELAAGRIAPVHKMDAAMVEAMTNSLNVDAELIVLDGYPRYSQQVNRLKEIYPLDKIIVVRMSCTEKVAFNRLMSRNRPDDTPQAIDARHNYYTSVTRPAIDQLMKEVTHRIVVPIFTTSDEYWDYFNRELKAIRHGTQPYPFSG